MRRFDTNRVFDRMFKKLPRDVRDRFVERAELFIKDHRHPLLRDHALTGAWAGHRSINVTGDYRAVYEEVAADTFRFVAIGTHHDLYGA
ncbi:MAG: type II toxin-antitoxin system mRNA interferase toxin, RelE/StbE family [Patescibacteria group bacterium]